MRTKIFKFHISIVCVILCLLLSSCSTDKKAEAYEKAVENGFSGSYNDWVRDISDTANFIIITDYVTPNTKEDVSDAIQSVIDENPNQTIYFPDGEYVISKPILTPADPLKSVSLELSNYAIIKASSDWSSDEAMIRLGASSQKNDIYTPGSNYYLSGGIIDGSNKAKGISIDGGRETRIEDVSIKNTLVGLHIKHGANSGSSDADISNVNIVGCASTDSIGVLIDGYDNTLSNMRIARVQVGVMLNAQGNFLRNIHPLYISDNQLNSDTYRDSVGFWDKAGGNWFDICYSDQFSTGFRMNDKSNSIYDKCFCFWYAVHGPQTGFRADGQFSGIIKNGKVVFHGDSPAEANAYISVKDSGGMGIIENPIFNESRSDNKAYSDYLSGKVLPT